MIRISDAFPQLSAEPPSHVAPLPALASHHSPGEPAFWPPEHDDHLWPIGALLPLVLARYDIPFDPDDGAGSSERRLTDCVSCR